MTLVPGFTLPEELRLLREQVRRFVREDIVPLEQQLDPDAPDTPRGDFLRLSGKTKAAGLWALGAPEEHVRRIGEEPSEVHRMAIARSLFR